MQKKCERQKRKGIEEFVVIRGFGVPWSPLESLGVPLSLLESLGVPRRPLESLAVPWSPLESLGVPWSTLESLGVLWRPLESRGVPLIDVSLHVAPAAGCGRRLRRAARRAGLEDRPAGGREPLRAAAHLSRRDGQQGLRQIQAHRSRSVSTVLS